MRAGRGCPASVLEIPVVEGGRGVPVLPSRRRLGGLARLARARGARLPACARACGDVPGAALGSAEVKRGAFWGGAGRGGQELPQGLGLAVGAGWGLLRAMAGREGDSAQHPRVERPGETLCSVELGVPWGSAPARGVLCWGMLLRCLEERAGLWPPPSRVLPVR